MQKTLREFCEEEGNRELLEQWITRRNLPLTPDTVSYGSRKKIWWQCGKGHTWQAAVYTRTGSRAGCPVCAGKLPVPGETDLAACYPKLAAQWHSEKNGAVTPDQVLPGSHMMVWWICEKGHVWQAMVKSRVNGSGCPICANREIRPTENDFAAAYPKLAAQWHPVRNGTLRPNQVFPGSRRRIWWICEKGHEWQASVTSRTSGSGCPYCTGRKVLPGFNDLASRFPELVPQWDTEKNDALTPQQVTPYANRRVWWRCPKGHVYQATVFSRTMNGSGCPYCAGKKVLQGFNDLSTREPELAKQWHPTLNGNFTPEMVTVGSHHKVWWICPQGHVWKAVVYSRTGPRRCSCPVCAGSAGGNRYKMAGMLEDSGLTHDSKRNICATYVQD